MEVWKRIDELLTLAEQSPTFKDDFKAQAKVLAVIGHPDHGYWQLSPDHQQAVLSRLMDLVPRVGSAPVPINTLAGIFGLYHSSNRPVEDIARAVNMERSSPRPLYDGEDIYPADGWLGTFCQRARLCEVPLGYFFWAGIGAMGAACRYSWYIDRRTDLLRMNHYLFFIGKPATGKSVAANAAKEVLSRMNRQLWPWEPGNPLPEYNAHPYGVRLLPDGTIQAIVRRLAFEEGAMFNDNGVERVAEVQSTGLLSLDELGTFLGKDAWSIATKIPVLTTLYSSDEYDYETVAGGYISLRKVALSIIGCSTPKWFRDALSPLMFTGGFMDRVLVVYRDPFTTRDFPTPPPPDPVVMGELAKWLTTLARRARPEEIVASRSAHEWYENWYRTYPEPADDFTPTVKRRTNLLWKTAGALALSEDGITVIEPRHFQQAAAIIQYEDERFQDFVGRLDRAPEVDHLEFIERKLYQAGAFGDNMMMRSELFNHLKHRKGLSPPTQRAVPYLLSLMAGGRIEQVDLKRETGRTGTGYRLTTLAAKDWASRLNPNS